MANLRKCDIIGFNNFVNFWGAEAKPNSITKYM